MYYVFNRQTNKPVAGAYPSVAQAATIVDLQPNRTDFYTASRYDLAKRGIYPRNKKGDVQLAKDLAENKIATPEFRMKWFSDIELSQ